MAGGPALALRLGGIREGALGVGVGVGGCWAFTRSGSGFVSSTMVCDTRVGCLGRFLGKVVFQGGPLHVLRVTIVVVDVPRLSGGGVAVYCPGVEPSVVTLVFLEVGLHSAVGENSGVWWRLSAGGVGVGPHMR